MTVVEGEQEMHTNQKMHEKREMGEKWLSHQITVYMLNMYLLVSVVT